MHRSIRRPRTVCADDVSIAQHFTGTTILCDLKCSWSIQLALALNSPCIHLQSCMASNAKQVGRQTSTCTPFTLAYFVAFIAKPLDGMQESDAMFHHMHAHTCLKRSQKEPHDISTMQQNVQAGCMWACYNLNFKFLGSISFVSHMGPCPLRGIPGCLLFGKPLTACWLTDVLPFVQNKCIWIGSNMDPCPVQGILGCLVFGEALSARWLTGMLFIMAGLLLVTRACHPTSPQHSKST